MVNYRFFDMMCIKDIGIYKVYCYKWYYKYCGRGREWNNIDYEKGRCEII